MNIISDYLTDLKKEFSGYNGSKLAKDVMAGITVAAVALPLALAFGVSSGATAAAGLVTAVIGGIFFRCFFSDVGTYRCYDGNLGYSGSQIRYAGYIDFLFLCRYHIDNSGSIETGKGYILYTFIGNYRIYIGDSDDYRFGTAR